jgi:hypothetical protein
LKEMEDFADVNYFWIVLKDWISLYFSQVINQQ